MHALFKINQHSSGNLFRYANHNREGNIECTVFKLDRGIYMLYTAKKDIPPNTAIEHDYKRADEIFKSWENIDSFFKACLKKEQRD